MTSEPNASNRSITEFGKFLRRTSLDELPQLINILFGQMNFIGPRPLPKESYTTRKMRIYKDKRLSVLPGLTGLSQINGRNQASWEKKFELDLWYVENWSFFLDLKILIVTIYKVLTFHGVNQSKEITSEPFKGNKE